MWKSGFCIFLVWLAAVIALWTNIIVTIRGSANVSQTDIKTLFKYDKMTMKFTQSIFPLEDSRESVTYDRAKKDICGSADVTGYNQDWCNAVKKVRGGGNTYLALTSLSVIFLSVALFLCILVTLGKCLCHCKYRFSLIIGILNLIAVIFLILALVLGLVQYINNLEDAATGMLWFYWSEYTIQNVDWKNGKAGVSIILQCVGCVIGIISLCVICICDRKNDKYEWYDSVKGEYIIVYPSTNDEGYGSHQTQNSTEMMKS